MVLRMFEEVEENRRTQNVLSAERQVYGTPAAPSAGMSIGNSCSTFDSQQSNEQECPLYFWGRCEAGDLRIVAVEA